MDMDYIEALGGAIRCKPCWARPCGEQLSRPRTIPGICVLHLAGVKRANTVDPETLAFEINAPRHTSTGEKNAVSRTNRHHKYSAGDQGGLLPINRLN